MIYLPNPFCKHHGRGYYQNRRLMLGKSYTTSVMNYRYVCNAMPVHHAYRLSGLRSVLVRSTK